MSDFTEKVRAMLAEATPGPWEDDAYVGDDPYDDPDVPFVKIGQTEWSPSRLEIPASLQQKRDAELIAAAPTLLREAVERIEKLEKVAEAAESMRFDGPNVYGAMEVSSGEGTVTSLQDALSALDAKEQS